MSLKVPIHHTLKSSFLSLRRQHFFLSNLCLLFLHLRIFLCLAARFLGLLHFDLICICDQEKLMLLLGRFCQDLLYVRDQFVEFLLHSLLILYTTFHLVALQIIPKPSLSSDHLLFRLSFLHLSNLLLLTFPLVSQQKVSSRESRFLC